ncbi:MAG: diguanylate cyclase [Gammaproteobacteria bacterium]|nr:diguanylate cyclase [Gammaproteobacteria bacterium]
MLALVGYQILDQLYKGNHYIVYRGIRLSDNLPVILKACRFEKPTLADLAALQHEFQLLKLLNVSGIIDVYELIKNQHQLVLVLEDIKGKSLTQFLEKKPMGLTEFFKIAIDLTEILINLHLQQIIHKDINPNNIIINPDTLSIKLIDFSIATQLSEENTEYLPVNKLEGTLAYISPEQTGRMNRPLDYRSDFYSLGVTFFQMLTGETPFHCADQLEMVHNHIAKIAPNVCEFNPNVPKQVGLIIAKLLAKMPEDRYLSAAGLKADLTKCFIQWQSHQKIDLFPLGQVDVHDQLNMSHRLYGRKEQLNQLLDAFERVGRGEPELLLVTGYSGIGKSSLVREIHKPVVQKKAYFVSGKYDQLQRATPYSAIITALDALVKQLLAESETKLTALKEKLLVALGDNGQVITDVIPSVELIIGAQKNVSALAPIDSQNRFIFTFQHFIHTLASAEHPLVFFFDDLQWVDSASLLLIQSLLTDTKLKHLLIIGAYRDNEVNAKHPLTIACQELRKAKVILHQVVLTPLTLHDIQQLLADSLFSSISRIVSLADLIAFKTQGNPFFINQFVKDLYIRHLLKFDHHTHQWHWDIEKIQAQNITDNVVDLLISRIKLLSLDVQNILKLAACIGYKFNLKTLITISEKSPQAVMAAVTTAVENNFIMPIDETYQSSALVNDLTMFREVDLSQLCYQFIHDRVQQAAYQLIADDERQTYHLQIGRLLLKEHPLTAKDDLLFTITDHLNDSTALITDTDEKVQLATFNLWAGQNAKNSNAYSIAKTYIQSGLTLLTPFNWSNQYDLLFALKKELAICQYLTSEFDAAELTFNELVANVHDKLPALEATQLHCEMLATMNRHQEAIRLGLAALKRINIIIPLKTNDLHILKAVLKVKWQVGFSGLHNIDLQPITSANYEAAINLITQLANSAFMSNAKLFVLLCATTMHLSLRWGYTPGTSYACLVYAFMLMHALNWYGEGLDYVKFHQKLIGKYSQGSLKGKNHFIFGNFIAPWRYSLATSEKTLIQASHDTYDVGDLVYSNYANCGFLYLIFHSGLPLNEVERHHHDAVIFLTNAKINDFLYIIKFANNICRHLSNKNKTLISELDVNEATMLSWNNKTELNLFYTYYTKLCYLMGQFDAARAAGIKHEQYYENGLGMLSNLDAAFYHCLSITANHSRDKVLNNKTLRLLHKRLHRWTKWNPNNFASYLALVDAEIARINNLPLRAINKYNQAMVTVSEMNNIELLAIVYECAGRFYQEYHMPIFAKTCMQHAYYAYQQWGAITKCKLLEDQYPGWFTEDITHSDAVNTTYTTTESSLTNIDILSILKFTQIISGEIQLDKLLQKLMVILLQNAGAQRGALLVKNNDNWLVEAEGSSAEQCVYLTPTQLITQRTDLPLTLINLAIRTQDLLIIQSPEEINSMTVEDPYLITVKPQSLLILPIIYQGKFKSLLYLENRITSYAFTNEHVQTLKLLASQAAISLENARLYYQSTHDPLTGLANRNLLYQVFDLVSIKAKRNHTQIAILFLDLDGFKKINDTLGHEVGDKLLQYVAQQLNACIREGDLAVRLGGDEFVIIMDDITQKSQIEVVAKGLLKRFTETILINNHEIHIGTSVGIGIYPDDGDDIQTILKYADSALYQVKSRGKGHYQFYQTEDQLH